jgi:hypothetical protein
VWYAGVLDPSDRAAALRMIAQFLTRTADAADRSPLIASANGRPTSAA